jgi:hypothetical protein
MATVSGTSINRIEGGKIVEQWSDWNLMTLMEQLGVSTAPNAVAMANKSETMTPKAEAMTPKAGSQTRA